MLTIIMLTFISNVAFSFNGTVNACNVCTYSDFNPWTH